MGGGEEVLEEMREGREIWWTEPRTKRENETSDGGIRSSFNPTCMPPDPLSSPLVSPHLPSLSPPFLSNVVCYRCPGNVGYPDEPSFSPGFYQWFPGKRCLFFLWRRDYTEVIIIVTTLMNWVNLSLSLWRRRRQRSELRAHFLPVHIRWIQWTHLSSTSWRERERERTEW